MRSPKNFVLHVIMVITHLQECVNHAAQLVHVRHAKNLHSFVLLVLKITILLVELVILVHNKINAPNVYQTQFFAHNARIITIPINQEYVFLAVQ